MGELNGKLLDACYYMGMLYSYLERVYDKRLSFSPVEFDAACKWPSIGVKKAIDKCRVKRKINFEVEQHISLIMSKAHPEIWEDPKYTERAVAAEYQSNFCGGYYHLPFGQKIKKMREEKGLSAEAVADKIEESAHEVASWEESSNYVVPTMKQLIKLSELFECSIEDLA